MLKKEHAWAGSKTLYNFSELSFGELIVGDQSKTYIESLGFAIPWSNRAEK